MAEIIKLIAKTLLTNIRFLITLALFTMLLLIMYGLFFLQIPQENLNMVNIMLGFIAGYCGNANNWWFGDTQSNAKLRNRDKKQLEQAYQDSETMQEPSQELETDEQGYHDRYDEPLTNDKEHTHDQH